MQTAGYNQSITLRTMMNTKISADKVEKPNLKSRACQYCDKVFSKVGILKVHIARLHIKARNHKCPICLKSFITNGNLLCHMTTHTTEKPFSCTKCNNTFKRKSSLKDHMVRHIGKKLHPCKDCGKMFLTRSYASTHKRQYERKQQTCKEKTNLVTCLKCFKTLLSSQFWGTFRQYITL